MHPETKNQLQIIFRRGAEFLALLLIVAYTATLGARYHWFLDMLSHFSFQYVIGAALLGTLLFIYKRTFYFVLMIVVFTANLFEMYRHVDLESVSATDNDLTIVQYNRRFQIFDHTDFIEWTKTNHQKFDVMILQEANAMMVRAGKDMIDLYPHQIHEARNHSFGMVVLSKHPMLESEIVKIEAPAEIALMKNFYIRLKIHPAESSEPVSIYAVHPVPPGGRELTEQRDYEIDAVRKAIQESSATNVIMIGDLNLTPYSPIFADLLQNTGLKYALSSPYPYPTWPKEFGFHVYQIPIDHILHKGNLKLVEKYRGPHMGSDHYPVVATYNLPAHND